MRRLSCLAAVMLVVAAGCPALARTPDSAAGVAPPAPSQTAPPPVGLAVPGLLREAARHPELSDLARYLEVRGAVAAADVERAIVAARTLLEQHPDSIWAAPARLDVGRLRRRAGDPAGARDWLEAAAAPPRGNGAVGTVADLLRAEAAFELGDDATALALATRLRETPRRAVAVHRARRLVERIRRRSARGPTAQDRLEEADRRLAEGDARGAQADALAVLADAPSRDARDQALWIQARASWKLGMREAAEALCLAFATGEQGAYSARALAQAARWRWNADDDVVALRLFRELERRFPSSREGPEALYAMARIHQEAAAYPEALQAYDALAERYPGSRTAADARWRAAWVRYLSHDYAGAAERFGNLAPASERGIRIAAEYWEARALEHLGAPEARTKFAHVAEQHATSFYGILAAARLGMAPRQTEERLDGSRPPFPDSLTAPEARRARRYGMLGLHRLARWELDALAGSTATDTLLQAYAAVEAPGPAIRLARSSLGRARQRFLYPLGYWEVVRPMAESRGLDPLFVAALIRQESLFVPDAVSPADAHGLMQLLPATAGEVAAAAGRPAPGRDALHRVNTNVDLGTALLRRLLDRYGGSAVKMLAAYNAGEDAVAKWERRHAGRPDDEFVELISYRETRDYVKAVLTHYEIYRQLYASDRTPSDSATRRGSPPKAPFDMITMTSPEQADSIR